MLVSQSYFFSRCIFLPTAILCRVTEVCPKEIKEADVIEPLQIK